MHIQKLAAAGCLTAALAVGVAACGSDDDGGGGGGGGGGGATEDSGASSAKQLTIYSSLPLQGASRVQSEAVVEGAKLALEQAGGKAGPHTITYTSLDDSTAQAGAWTPETESANARKAIGDDSTILYLGTLNSGAAKISIPLLNEAKIPMLSPANTYVGLTSNEPGSEPGEPWPTTPKYGKKADPYAIYGYEAMQLALDAIVRSKTGEREDVNTAIHATKDRDSVLGTYSIDANGDTSLTDYGSYTIKDGELQFDKTIKAQTH